MNRKSAVKDAASPQSPGDGRSGRLWNKIVSHEYCRDEVVKMAAAVPPGSKFVKREGAADGTEDRKIAIPVTTFNDKMTYRVGNIVVEFLFLGVAHT